MAAITVEIGGIDRTNYVGAGTVSIDGAINGKYSLSAVLRPNTSGFRPTRGSTFVVKENGTKRFAGNIFAVTERDASGSRGVMEYSIRCVDYNHIANRRRFAGEFTGPMFLNQIVDQIASSGLSGEGVTIATITSPPVITETLTFKYETVAACFNKLTALTGYLWYIDFDKVLRFSPFTSTIAPVSVTDASSTWRDLEIERSDEDKRNRQYVRTEAQLRLIYNETYTIVQDGQDFIPTTAGPTEWLSISVNGVAKTFTSFTPGTTPTPGYDFYWSDIWMGVFTLGWASGNPASGLHLASGDLIAFSYRGAGRNVVMAEDTFDQEVRRTAEGGSGIWEAIEEQRNIGTYNALLAIANGRLAQNGNDSIRARFETDVSGVAPAQRVTINVPRWSVNQELLIERVTSTWIAASDDFFRHRVSCVGLDLAVESPETSPEGTTYIEPVAQPETYMERVVEMARIGETPAQIADESGVGDRILQFVVGDNPLGVSADATDNHPECVLESADRKWRPYAWSANVKTAPIGAAIEWNADYSEDKSTWTQFASGSIGAGAFGGDGSVTAVDIPAGAWFRLDITQVGTTTKGAGLTVQIRGQEI